MRPNKTSRGRKYGRGRHTELYGPPLYVRYWEIGADHHPTGRYHALWLRGPRRYRP